MADVARLKRLGDHELTADFDDVPNVTKRAVINGIAMSAAAGMPFERAIVLTGDRACEAFDRAFALSRIKAAGVNLDDHPEYRSYQIFFELRLPPPSHAGMADTIIELLTPL